MFCTVTNLCFLILYSHPLLLLLICVSYFRHFYSNATRCLSECAHLNVIQTLTEDQLGSTTLVEDIISLVNKDRDPNIHLHQHHRHTDSPTHNLILMIKHKDHHRHILITTIHHSRNHNTQQREFRQNSTRENLHKDHKFSLCLQAR